MKAARYLVAITCCNSMIFETCTKRAARQSVLADRAGGTQYPAIWRQHSSMPSLRGVKRRSNPAFLAGPRWIASLALAMTTSERGFLGRVIEIHGSLSC